MTMARQRGSKCDGGSWSQKEIDAVFAKTTNQKKYNDGDITGDDPCGTRIWKSKHGDTDSDYGWEIDHIKPCSKGGTDTLTNLQPLHWETNREKGSEYPWTCPK